MKHLLAAAAAAIFSVSAAYAQARCAPSIHVLLALDRLGEIEHQSLDHAEIRWTMWLNEATGSWTLTGTKGSITCVFAGGRNGYRGQRIEEYLLNEKGA